MIDVPNWKEVKAWRWPHFLPEEMACRGDGSLKLDEAFMDDLEALRVSLDFAFKVTSGYRSPAYNEKVAESGTDGPHTEGKAIDLSLIGEQAYRVLAAAPSFGFTGIGLLQKGPPEKRIIHLDTCLATPTRPRPWCWTY